MSCEENAKIRRACLSLAEKNHPERFKADRLETEAKLMIEYRQTILVATDVEDVYEIELVAGQRKLRYVLYRRMAGRWAC